MAVSGVSSSRSIYGTRNVITGLASGMDTESMIENAISAYKNKITALNQKRTKTEWKQDAYRSMINKMSSFLSKYTSYRSSNNLMSTSFFDSAVKTVTKGKYADMVSATGRANSDIRIDRVKQLASAATYKLSGTALDGSTAAFGEKKVTAVASGELKLDETIPISNLNGSLTVAYGGSNATSYLTINFDETKTFEDTDALVEEINKQLESQSVSIGTKTYTGKDLLNNVIKAEVGSDGQITFADPKKNGVYVSGATGSAKEHLLGGAEPSSEAGKQIKSLTLSADALDTTELNTLEYLSTRGASMEITLDGKTKTIKLPGEDDIDEKLTGKDRDKAFIDALNKNIEDAFGKNKLTVSDANADKDGTGIKFQFETNQKGSTFAVGSSKGEILGFGEGGRVTSYLNTSRTLGELLKDKDFGSFEKAYVEKKDADGNTVKELATDANGKQLYSFRVNGKEIGQFNEDTALSTVFNAMNSNSDSEVKVAYSKLTNELTFTAKETGMASKVDFRNPEDVTAGSLSDALFGIKSSNKLSGNLNEDYDLYMREGETGRLTVKLPGAELSFDVNKDTTVQDVANAINQSPSGMKYTASVNEYTGKLMLTNKNGGGEEEFSMSINLGGVDWEMPPPETDVSYTVGRDAIFEATVNGTSLGEITRSSNTVDMDGMSITLKGTFETKEGEDPVTFETSSDADKIVDAVKQMVEDYNAMAKEIKDAYSTLPAQRSNGAYYEPLTAEEEEGETESFIKNWTEKAKQGILFGDRDLASLYQRMTNAIAMNGEHGAALREAGITVNYSNGLSTLEFDEDKFRAALNNDPDKVRDAFTASVESGAKSNGLMQALKQPLDIYGKTEGGKGVLVEKAGSPLAASTMYNNTIQKELNRIDEEIARWQDKMENQIDHYTNQFSRLEQLIQQMNSQSSYFSQLMGG